MQNAILCVFIRCILCIVFFLYLYASRCYGLRLEGLNEETADLLIDKLASVIYSGLAAIM